MSAPERSQRLRVALFGSPAFALPALDALADRHALVLVVAQPDKRAGRGMRVTAPDAARRARELGIALEQPERLKGNGAFRERLGELRLDVAVTAAYGKILPADLLAVPPHGFLNVHASLLPRYRGAAPVQWALINAERETGVSIMQTEAGLDTGPVCLQRAMPIPPGATTPTLMGALAKLGAQALLAALEQLLEGSLACAPQDEAAATYAPMLSREDGRIRWGDPAEAVAARHRGVGEWPGSRFAFEAGSGREDVKVSELRLAPAGAPGPASVEAGTVLAVDAEGVTVACGRGAVVLARVQPPGKRAMGARDWANGHGVRQGVRLG